MLCLLEWRQGSSEIREMKVLLKRGDRAVPVGTLAPSVTSVIFSYRVNLPVSIPVSLQKCPFSPPPFFPSFPLFLSLGKLSLVCLVVLLSIYLFIWLSWVLVSAHGIFSCSVWDLVPWPEIEPGPPALGPQSLSHWTTRGAPQLSYCFFVPKIELGIVSRSFHTKSPISSLS